MSHEPPKSAIDEFKGKQGLTRLINALGYSKDGLSAAWKNEAAFREEVLLAAVAFPLAFYLGQTGIERALLAGEDRRELVAHLPTELQAGELDSLFAAARQVHVGPRLLDYVQALLEHSRAGAGFSLGLSPRAGLGLLAAARAWA